MDEYFESFLEDNGPGIATRAVPSSSIEQYRGHLPNQLLSYWQEHGWSAYAGRRLWIVNPQDYEPVIDAFLAGTAYEGTDRYHVIARGAFGDLFVWGEQQGRQMTIMSLGSLAVPAARRAKAVTPDVQIRSFFVDLSPEDGDFENMFDEAQQALGPLSYDEMYAFVPALALGGEARFGNLQRVKAVEHLLFLAQLQPLEFLNVSDL